jgi:hypothetical protein
MKKIKVFVYAYKNKNLLKQIINLKENESKNNEIFYYVYDQININREEIFNDLDYVKYKHIHWYNTSSISKYRDNNIFNKTNYDFYLEINSNINLPKSWDDFLIKNLNDRTVISGKNKISLSIDNFKIKKEIIKSEEISLTNYIDMDLIFTKTINSLSLINLKILKDFGQDLYSSVLFLKRGVSIVSLPDNFYTISEQKNINTYRPYSKTHGYNKMLKIIKEQDNTFFENFHKINLSKLNYMPYQNDDVYYSDPEFNLYNTEHLKFHKGYSKIYVL